MVLHSHLGLPISLRASVQAPTRIYKPSGTTLASSPIPSSSSLQLFSPPWLLFPQINAWLPLLLLQNSVQTSVISEASLLKAENLPPHQTSLSSIPALLFFSVILFTISHTLCFTCSLSIRPHTLDYKLHESKMFVYFVPSAYSAWHRAGTEIFILGINTSGTPISKHNLYQKIIKKLIIPKSLLHWSHLGRSLFKNRLEA